MDPARGTGDSPTSAESSDGSFHMKTVEALTGLNRGSLVYYEKRGILKPSRSAGSGYRLYTPGDLNRIVSLCVMKNSGLLVTDAWPEESIPGTQENVDGFLNGCIEGNERVLAWHRAVEERLGEMQRLFGAESMLVPRLRTVEAQSVWFNHPAPHVKPSPATIDGPYLKLSPIASFTCIYELDALMGAEPLDGRWGVSIPSRLLASIDRGDDGRLDQGAEFDARECATLPIRFSATTPHIVDTDLSMRRLLLDFMDERDLRPCGPAMLLDYLPVGQTVCATLNVPVA